MRKRQKRSEEPSLLGYYLRSSDGSLPVGYHRLLDSPEVAQCVNWLVGLISSTPIALMRNTKKGNVREWDRLARFIDVTPCGSMTRQAWMGWIVQQMLTEGDGNAYILPEYSADGGFSRLIPMPGAVYRKPTDPLDMSYRIEWNGRSYHSDDIVPFALFPDPDDPRRGRGFKVAAGELATSLKQTSELKRSLSAPDYRPPMIVSVDTDSDLTERDTREEFRRMYLEDNEQGKPWILPRGLVSVEQVKPLSLADLAVKDTVELDRKAIASLIGVPGYVTGASPFDLAEHNACVRGRVIQIVTGIEQVMTMHLLRSDDRFFRFNRRHLYAYSLSELIDIYTSLQDRGDATGDEVREAAMMDPAGLTEFEKLENFIPVDKLGKQKKLIQEALKDAQ